MLREFEITTAELGASVPARPHCGCENTDGSVRIQKQTNKKW